MQSLSVPTLLMVWKKLGDDVILVHCPFKKNKNKKLPICLFVCFFNLPKFISCTSFKW